MSDLTKRLREVNRVEKLTSPQRWAVDEAADRIEELEGIVRELVEKRDFLINNHQLFGMAGWVNQMREINDAFDKARAALEEK